MSVQQSTNESPAPELQLHPASEVQNWLIDQLSELLEVEPEEIDPERHFMDYGLSSAEAVILAGDLGEWLGYHLPHTLLWDHPSIAALANFVGKEYVPPKRPK